MDLVNDVALHKGISWRDNRTHWRDSEGYNLAKRSRMGGRLFPKSDERPDKPRKIEHIDRYTTAHIVYTDSAEDEILPANDLHEEPTAQPADDLYEIYGDQCYLAVYTQKPTATILVEDTASGWDDGLPLRIGMRKSVVLELGKSVVEIRNRKHRCRRGHRKTVTRQDIRNCDIRV